MSTNLGSYPMGARNGLSGLKGRTDAGTRLHPNGVKARPWETQKVSRIGGHVEGVRVKRPSPLDEVNVLKPGERPAWEQAEAAMQYHGIGLVTQNGAGAWETENPWETSATTVGGFAAGADSLGRVNLQQEKRNALKKAIENDPKFSRRPQVVPPPPPQPVGPLDEPRHDPAAAAAREVQRRAERAMKYQLTDDPQRAEGVRTQKGLRAEELARMRERAIAAAEASGGGGGGRSGSGGGGGSGSGSGSGSMAMLGGGRPAVDMDPAFAKPGDWHSASGQSDKQKLEAAVAELCRRQPGMTPLQAVQKLGGAMEAKLNAPNRIAADHFQAQNTRRAM